MKTVAGLPNVKLSFLCLAAIMLLALAGIACQRAATNVNTTISTNANTNVNLNANVSTETTAAIAAREPDKYKATLVFSAETEGGEKTVGIPSLSAEVARNGADRRLAFKLPDGSDLIYLEQGDKHIVIAPARKQYAELTPEATGFQLQKLMTPGQLVSYLGRLKGVVRVGEEQMAGRTAEKFSYSNTTNTSTSAGEVKTEAFVFVDKETGLPLRAELFTEATGNVQGVKGAKVVAEMRDITTTVDDTLFQVPEGLNKVPPEQVRQQIDAITGTVAALIRTLLSNINSSAAAAGSSPVLVVSPAPTVSPATSPR